MARNTTTDRNNTDRSSSKNHQRKLDFQTFSASPLYFLISLMVVIGAVTHGCRSSQTPDPNIMQEQETQVDDSDSETSAPIVPYGLPDDLEVSPEVSPNPTGTP